MSSNGTEHVHKIIETLKDLSKHFDGLYEIAKENKHRRLKHIKLCENHLHELVE